MTEVSRARIREQIKATAASMLAGQMDLIEGTRRIDALATELDLGFQAPYVTFKGIASQTDDFPDDGARTHYAPELLRRLDDEKRRSLELFRAQILDACRLVLRSD